MRGVRIDDPDFLILYINWTLHGDQVMASKDFHRMLDEKVEEIKTSASHLKEHYVIRWNFIMSLMEREGNARLREVDILTPYFYQFYVPILVVC